MPCAVVFARIANKHLNELNYIYIYTCIVIDWRCIEVKFNDLYVECEVKQSSVLLLNIDITYRYKISKNKHSA